MPKIKQEELDRVYNSLHKPKERVLPANRKQPRKIDYVSDLKTSKEVIYFIDGYNLMHSVDEIKEIALSDLISARDKVIDIVSDYQGYVGKQCVLVFDAYNNNIPVPVMTKQYNIAIVYTQAGQTADTYIEQKTRELGEGYKIFVVTSDNLEQLKVFSASCLRLSSREFLHRYENYKKTSQSRETGKRHQPMKELRKLLYED